MMWWDGDGFGAWGLIAGGISMLLFWGLVVLAIIALVRYLGRSAGRSSPSRPTDHAAEQLLAERFARGEIDEQTYRRGVEVLREQHSPAGDRR